MAVPLGDEPAPVGAVGVHHVERALGWDAFGQIEGDVATVRRPQRVVGVARHPAREDAAAAAVWAHGDDVVRDLVVVRSDPEYE